MQIYCPYLVVNKTGLPFAVRPGRSNRIGGAQDMAGETRAGTLEALLMYRCCTHDTAYRHVIEVYAVQ